MDEDLEFRDMVLKKLEESGSLLGIKAKLRALLHDIIENEHPAVENTNESDVSSSTFEKESIIQLDGKALAFELMLEMLGSMNFHYTKQILLAESGHRRTGITHEQLLHQLGLKTRATCDNLQQEPLLLTIIEKLRGDTGENSCEIDTATDLSPGSKVCSSSNIHDNNDSQKNNANE